MLTPEELEELLALGHESRSFEVKGPLDLGDRSHCAKVARAVMAMGNLRDGGVVCLGIDQDRMQDLEPGLDAAKLAQWSDFDNVSAALARFCDPPVTFEVVVIRLSNGRDVVALVVSEFDDVPYICKREYPRELKDGAVYVRPRGKPESRPVPSSSEMRELLDLAINKGVGEFVRRARAAGILLSATEPAVPSDREAYLDEGAAAWGAESRIMADILRRGHTDVALRPGPFNPQRLAPSALEAFLTDHTVRLRGWPVPFVDGRNDLLRLGERIGQDVEPRVVPHEEAWRLCTSGQFLHRRVLAGELRGISEARATSPDSPGVVIVWDVLLYMVEVAEMGARVATSLGVEEMAFEVSLGNIAGRELVSGDWNRDLHGSYVMSADRISAAQNVPVDRLTAKPRQLGVDLAQALLGQFGLNIPDQVLFDWQEQVFAPSGPSVS